MPHKDTPKVILDYLAEIENDARELLEEACSSEICMEDVQFSSAVANGLVDFNLATPEQF